MDHKVQQALKALLVHKAQLVHKEHLVHKAPKELKDPKADVKSEKDLQTYEPIFADGLVQHAGQSLFAVAATSMEAARRAARLAKVEYEELPAVLDVRTALAPVAQMATQGLLFYVSAGSPINSIRDLVAEGKRNPGRVSYGSTGVGSVAITGSGYYADGVSGTDTCTVLATDDPTSKTCTSYFDSGATATITATAICPHHAACSPPQKKSGRSFV